jgi:hypothetical protein
VLSRNHVLDKHNVQVVCPTDDHLTVATDRELTPLVLPGDKSKRVLTRLWGGFHRDWSLRSRVRVPAPAGQAFHEGSLRCVDKQPVLALDLRSRLPDPYRQRPSQRGRDVSLWKQNPPPQGAQQVCPLPREVQKAPGQTRGPYAQGLVFSPWVDFSLELDTDGLAPRTFLGSWDTGGLRPRAHHP